MEAGFRDVVVEKSGKLCGMVTDRDIVDRAIADGRNPRRQISKRFAVKRLLRSPEPPNLGGWELWCNMCKAFRSVPRFTNRDVGTGEVYYERVCQECFEILITMQRANADDRERQLWGSSQN